MRPIRANWTDVDGDSFWTAATASAAAGNRRLQDQLSLEGHDALIGNFVGDDGIIDLIAYSVVKNEPY